MVETAIIVGNALKQNGIDTEIINARFIKPLDESLILESVKKTKKIVTLEDNIVVGGFGSGVSEMLCKNEISCKMKAFGFPDQFIEHGNMKDLFKKYHLDAQSITEELMNF
jgi:1-deoxy-D-xylulose-5-phosphate synthase